VRLVHDVSADGRWTVYVLISCDLRRTYVGITHDLDRRLAQHNGLAPGGARATRYGRPWRIAATFGPCSSRAEAQRAEARLKRERGRARLDCRSLQPSQQAGLLLGELGLGDET